jgi:hypothetical protein
LARQLCAGLAAAHDCGVLHRDLKPANVLIDGRGRVRIADFGLADLINRRHDRNVLAGTPAYMAPEQLAGEAASMLSDVYALGLVLYEMFTGKPAFKIVGADLLALGAAQSPPARPSTLIPDMDLAIERVILQCIEHDPTRRPPSAIGVAAALPGGDPLAAALAAGETPSPDMVAAAGDVGSLSPARGLACLAVMVIGLITLVWMSPQTTLTGFVTMDKGPEVLAERARTIARNLGYTDRPADEAYGYESDTDYLRYIAEHNRVATRWQVLRTGRPAALLFWHRQSPYPLISVSSRFETNRRSNPIRALAHGARHGVCPHGSGGSTHQPDGCAGADRRALGRCAPARLDGAVRRGRPADRGVLSGETDAGAARVRRHARGVGGHLPRSGGDPESR